MPAGIISPWQKDLFCTLFQLMLIDVYILSIKFIIIIIIKAFAVGFSRRWRDHRPLTEAGRRPCGLLGALERSMAGLRACWVRPRSSPFLALQRACALVGDWPLEVP